MKVKSARAGQTVDFVPKQEGDPADFVMVTLRLPTEADKRKIFRKLATSAAPTEEDIKGAIDDEAWWKSIIYDHVVQVHNAQVEFPDGVVQEVVTARDFWQYGEMGIVYQAAAHILELLQLTDESKKKSEESSRSSPLVQTGGRLRIRPTLTVTPSSGTAENVNASSSMVLDGADASLFPKAGTGHLS